jgi:hypothetical protein
MNKVTNKTKKFFTQIPNDLIRNSSISDRARFLYCYMSSMSEDWQFYQSKMAKDLGYSKDTLRKYLDELVSTGYLKKTQRRSELGRFDSYDYVIDFIPNPDLTVSEKTRNGEIPTPKNPILKKNNFKEEQIIKNINLQEDVFENEFSTFEKITIEDSQSSKVNPFTIVAKLQSEKERKTFAPQKERKADAEPKPERKPNPTYEAFTVFCQTFEQLSGAAYPTDQKGHYIMSPKDAGGMVYLMRWLEKVDRNNDTNEALKVFLQAAWSLPDKWLKANFTPPILYGQANKVYTAYQTSSPAAKKKAYDDEADRLLNEYIQTLKQTQ